MGNKTKGKKDTHGMGDIKGEKKHLRNFLFQSGFFYRKDTN